MTITDSRRSLRAPSTEHHRPTPPTNLTRNHAKNPKAQRTKTKRNANERAKTKAPSPISNARRHRPPSTRNHRSNSRSAATSIRIIILHHCPLAHRTSTSNNSLHLNHQHFAVNKTLRPNSVNALPLPSSHSPPTINSMLILVHHHRPPLEMVQRHLPTTTITIDHHPPLLSTPSLLPIPHNNRRPTSSSNPIT